MNFACWLRTLRTEIARPLTPVSLFYFFAGAKVTVRTNEDAVNSVFMVQVKKNEQGLSQINLVRKNLGEVLLKRVESWFSARNLFGKDNLTA